MTHPSLLSASASQQQFGITVVRVVTGIVFAMHGVQKVFVYGLPGLADSFGKMGVPMPGVMGPFIGLLEFFGGLALIIGLLTRLAALGLAFDMLGAILLVHAARGFFLPSGAEFVLMLCASAFAIALAGPGALSVDGMIASRAHRRTAAVD